MEKLLILDLDETLVYATEERLPEVEVDAEIGPYLLYKRPGLNEFINYCTSTFKVAVWTSSSETYCKPVVELIFGNDETLEFVWARNRCTRKFDPEMQDYDFVKDLKKAKKRGFPLEQMIMIDDTPAKLRRNYGNLVYIRPFEGDQKDIELSLLMKYLEELKEVPNIRKVEKRGLRVKQIEAKC